MFWQICNLDGNVLITDGINSKNYKVILKLLESKK